MPPRSRIAIWWESILSFFALPHSLHGQLFGPLQDLATFNAVILDPEVGTLTWPNGADFDPATLHDWPAIADELAARAQRWANPGTDHARANSPMEPTRR
jgi:hypothetical protein